MTGMKFWKNTNTKAKLQCVPLPKPIFIGRLSAKTLPTDIVENLYREQQEIGDKELDRKILQESIILYQKKAEKNNLMEKILTICLRPLTKRVEQGISINNDFWIKTQKGIDDITSRKKLQILDEEIDYLRNRQIAYSENIKGKGKGFFRQANYKFPDLPEEPSSMHQFNIE